MLIPKRTPRRRLYTRHGGLASVAHAHIRKRSKARCSCVLAPSACANTGCPMRLRAASGACQGLPNPTRLAAPKTKPSTGTTTLVDPCSQSLQDTSPMSFPVKPHMSAPGPTRPPKHRRLAPSPTLGDLCFFRRLRPNPFRSHRMTCFAALRRHRRHEVTPELSRQPPAFDSSQRITPTVLQLVSPFH